MSSLAGWLYDQLREISRGADPNTLVEWSEIIEMRANERCKESNQRPIRFKGKVTDEERFALDFQAPNPASVVCLLEAIQGCLSLMPSPPRRFYAALMVSLASESEASDESSDAAELDD